MSAKILVTGASGFLGRHLVEKLVLDNQQVCCIVNSNPNSLKEFSGSARIYKVDLCDYNSAEKVIAKVKPGIIFHLAGYLGKSEDANEIRHAFESNVVSTLNLLTASNDINYSRFVFAGSYAEYGNQAVPFKEECRLDPVSSYGASKAAAETYCRLFQGYGKPVAILRFSALYGPYEQESSFIASAIRSSLAGKGIAMTQGNQTRDFLYVGDAVNALLKSAASRNAAGGIFNIGSGKEVQIRKIAEKIVKLCKSKSRINAGALPQRKNEVMRVYGDISKAKRLLEWHPETGLEDGLRKTIKWHREDYS